MKRLNWQFEDKKYSLILPIGKGIITEKRTDLDDPHTVGARYQFNAQINHNHGKLEVSEYNHKSFDDAENWIIWTYILNYDLVENDEKDKDKLFKSLDFCITFLPENEIEKHQENIEFIKLVISGDHKKSEKSTENTKNKIEIFQTFSPFTWTETNDEYISIVPQGKAVIKELRNENQYIIGRASTFHPRFEKPDGEIIHLHQGLNFEAAEDDLKWFLLYTIHPPQGNEDPEIEDLEETLDLCMESLPEGTDFHHHYRLDYLKGRLIDILY